MRKLQIQRNIEDAVVRNITLVQTGLQVFRGTSRSISGSVGLTATPAEKWMQVNHWALDVRHKLPSLSSPLLTEQMGNDSRDADWRR